MHVELLTFTPEAQVLVACAAKLCYSASDIDSLMQKQTPEAVERFLDKLASMGHESPLEHAYFTFGIEGVSRALLAQITRHRIASFSVQSQRYVKSDCFEYVVPHTIEQNPQAKAVFIQAMESAQRSYDELAQILKQDRYEQLVAQGVDAEAAKKQAERGVLEDARFVLPNACATKMMVSMNARSLLNFFHHRCCNRAQWEIRELATQMLLLVKQVAPTIFRKAGPGCVSGPCPEGSMSCGQAAQVRKYFAELEQKNG